MRAPFPWFGGKRQVADVIWARLGDPSHYIEPFAGSLAVLLARKSKHRLETVNDLDGYLCNFWRALQADPDGVARHCDWPVNELDIHARHRWLNERKAEFTERLRNDPELFDSRMAGWWAWGASAWIGDQWARATPQTAVPHLGDSGHGVHRASLQIPHLGNSGHGVHRASLQIPHLGNSGVGVHRAAWSLHDELRAIAARIRRVRVCCGDWTRVVTPAVLGAKRGAGYTAVLLDPPYLGTEKVYAERSSVFDDVRAWAIEHGSDPSMRIALCGHDDGRQMPDGWETYVWKAHGGYGNSGDGAGRENAERERIWFSPACQKVAKQQALF